MFTRGVNGANRDIDALADNIGQLSFDASDPNKFIFEPTTPSKYKENGSTTGTPSPTKSTLYDDNAGDVSKLAFDDGY